MASTPAARILASLALSALIPFAQGASAVHKCIVDGSVTFQSTPCPADKPARRPTAEELNAERKKRLAEAAARAASAPTTSQPTAPATQRPVEPQPSSSPKRDPAFRCDGRQHCSQMRSCAEAKYFLANCPDTKMDGNRDGVPCEQQWCTHPFAK